MKNKKPAYIGLSINRQRVELAVYSPKTNTIEKVVTMAMPVGIFDADGDQIIDPVLLKDVIGRTLRSMKPMVSRLHVSLPGTLLRMVEMPRMDSDALYLSLSSEAERYRTFDGTEAVADFTVLDGDKSNPQQTVVFGAVRSDSLAVYMRIFKDLRVKPATIGLEPLNILRAMAGSGVLDGLMQEIGADAYWGTIFVEPSRVRLMIWQGNRLIDLRETAMDISQVAAAGSSEFFIVEDLLEEIRRTTKNTQPSVWFVNDLPEPFRQSLTERLGVPIFPTTLGESLGRTDPSPVGLSTVGSTMASLVEYPFHFDIAQGYAHIGGNQGAAGGSKDLGASDDSGPGPLIIGGGVLSAIAIAITLLLMFLTSLSSQQVPDLTSKRDSAQMLVSAKQSEVTELKRKVALDQSLLQAVRNAQIRNQIYIALTSDLKRKTPQQVWIQTLSAGDNDQLSIAGKAMNQSAVIHFAQSFDDALYTKAILIDAITEEHLHDTTVYDFKFSGGIRLAPQLLPPDPTTPDPSAAGPAPAGTMKKQAKV